MRTLSKELRRTLEGVVVEARRIAEAGAEQALKELAVHHFESWPAMTPEQKGLREKLRAHGKQLGDDREANRTQEILRLKEECAYQQWHRMLFARFLAENSLLIHPEYLEPTSLEEVKEIAREQNADWLSIAASFAQKMLLEVFRADDPVLDLILPPEIRQKLEENLASLPPQVFTAEDSLGWVYQFWQRDEKERVNKSEVKIGSDELPAVTQLFTDDYMVLFLLENTMGAWWTAKRRAEGKEPALTGYTWTFLRLNEDGSPVAGTFSGWPRAASELRVLDPCMGSGHFLVFTLSILSRMRMEEEGLTHKQALAAVIRDNLFGLEIDARCAQIAAFNLALAAWRLSGEYFLLPAMNLACSGLGIHATEADWLKLASDDGPAREEMRRLYSLFKDAPTLGSLIDPLRLYTTVYTSGADRVLPLIEEALLRERTSETRELVIAAQGVIAAFRILASRFTLVATNVPYVGRGRQDLLLGKYCSEFHPDAKADLATCFVERCLHLSSVGGSVAVVTPQNWLFLTSYRKFRERLLKDEQWDVVVRLGEHAFDSPAAAGAFAALVCLTTTALDQRHSFFAVDVSRLRTPAEKAVALITKDETRIQQSAQLTNPDQRLILDLDHDTSGNFAQYASSYQGAVTGDLERFTSFHWEIADIHKTWEPFRTTVGSASEDNGLMCAIRWQGGTGDLSRYARETKEQLHDMHESGQKAWGKAGVAINRMRGLSATVYDGMKFDNNVAVLIPEDHALLLPILCFCKSDEFARSVRNLDQTLKVTNQTLRKVAFDLERWQDVAAATYPNGLPTPHSQDPTQWLFGGNPRYSTHPLQVAVARLVGYRWPRQRGWEYPGCPSLLSDGLECHSTGDGIVCLSSVAGEAPAADRLRVLLGNAFGSDWSASKLAGLLGDCESLEMWLRDRFFAEHCDVFRNRPFIWHIWDGRKDGFHALVNYHMLAAPNGEGRNTLEKLAYTALGDWIARQKAEVASSVDGADSRLAAAQHLQSELLKILEGEGYPDQGLGYDIFVRWKPVHEQAIGWEPDINDGVRLNIRPWLSAPLAAHTKPKKGACILRITPAITYGKDRGKDPARDEANFPWFADSADRKNDVHLSLEQKRAARERSKK